MYVRSVALVVLIFGMVADVLSDDQIIAIDVLLQPDQIMLEKASRWNVKMRELTPKGFELDEAHTPHVTLIQRHVRKEDLESVLDAVDRVRNSLDVTCLKMVAKGLYHIPSGDLGLAGITIEPSKELLLIQRAVIDAVNPYDAGTGNESAYVPDPTNTPFDPYLFKYVETFVPEQTGDKFNPHVTIGLAPISWLEIQESQPFEKFHFGAIGLATYQLGNFGTAANRLD